MQTTKRFSLAPTSAYLHPYPPALAKDISTVVEFAFQKRTDIVTVCRVVRFRRTALFLDAHHIEQGHSGGEPLRCYR